MTALSLGLKVGSMNPARTHEALQLIDRKSFQKVGSKRRPCMKIVQLLVFRVFLLVTFLTTYLYFLCGREPEHYISVARNAAWNDLVHQIDPSVDTPAHDTLGKEVILIQNFLRDHQSEVSVGLYDVTVFRAIDQVRARLQKADKDLETIRNELSYRENERNGGR